MCALPDSNIDLSDAMQPELSIIVPVYNEEATIVSVMHRLQEVCGAAQHIYVDDGSKDRSLTLMRENAREHDAVMTKENGGKGSAIRMGLGAATGTFTTIQDADLEYDPAELRTLLRIMKEKGGRAAFGSRFLQKNPNIYKRYLLGNKVLTGMINVLFGSKLTDSYTCFKVLRTDDFRDLNLLSNGFEMEAEITTKLLKQKIEIIEVPIRYKPRTLAEGKKIGWKDAWKGMVMMFLIRLGK